MPSRGISSARCTNEENYLMQKFIRAVIGTNNIDGCARVCHSPTALGMQRTFGTGAATNSVADLKHTSSCNGNRGQSNGCASCDRCQAEAASDERQDVDRNRSSSNRIGALCNYHIQLRPGTNVAVLNMLLYYIITEGKEHKDSLRIAQKDMKI
jgi:formate dehydrogenase major subunit